MKTYISADYVFPRIVELLGNSAVDLMRVTPPTFRICKDKETQLGRTMLLWEVERPEFVIDEAELPY